MLQSLASMVTPLHLTYYVASYVVIRSAIKPAVKTNCRQNVL